MKAITAEAILGLAGDLLAEGTEVWGPGVVHGRIEYRRLRGAADLKLDAELPAFPLKRLFLPPSEPLFEWRRMQGELSLVPAPHRSRPIVVLGARPCDASALEAVDRVMGWDYRDDLWFARREAATIVGMVCNSRDEACFCDELGLGPEATRGTDLFLVPDGSRFLVQEITEKGRALAANANGRFTECEEPRDMPARRPPAGLGHRFDLESVRGWLAAHFDDDSWDAMGLRCHGCAVCASVCPACHCFDIVDEPESVDSGTRRRNWDSCQLPRFTLHASGYNPRPDQHTRFRQRVMHKFRVFPDRFECVLCTGCGRCTRACPAGQDLLEILCGVEARAAAEREGQR